MQEMEAVVVVEGRPLLLGRDAPLAVVLPEQAQNHLPQPRQVLGRMPLVSRGSATQALTRSGQVPSGPGLPRAVLPSIGMWTKPRVSQTPLIQSVKQRWKASGSMAENTRLNVSCDDGPFGKVSPIDSSYSRLVTPKSAIASHD